MSYASYLLELERQKAKQKAPYGHALMSGVDTGVWGPYLDIGPTDPLTRTLGTGQVVPLDWVHPVTGTQNIGGGADLGTGAGDTWAMGPQITGGTDPITRTLPTGQVVPIDFVMPTPVPQPVLPTVTLNQTQTADPVVTPTVNRVDPVVTPVVNRVDPVVTPTVNRVDPVVTPTVNRVDPVVTPVVNRVDPVVTPTERNMTVGRTGVRVPAGLTTPDEIAGWYLHTYRGLARARPETETGEMRAERQRTHEDVLRQQPMWARPRVATPITTPAPTPTPTPTPTPAGQDFREMQRQLAESQRRSRVQSLAQAKMDALTALEGEQAAVARPFQAQRNRAAAAADVAAMNFAQYMAARGIRGAAGAMPEIYRQAGLQAQLGALDESEAAAMAGIERQRGRIRTGYLSDVERVEADIEAQEMQNIIDEWGAARDYALRRETAQQAWDAEARDFGLREQALQRQWGESDRDFALRQQAAQRGWAADDRDFALRQQIAERGWLGDDRDFALRQQAAQRGWATDDRDFALRQQALQQQWGESDRDFALRQQAAQRGWAADDRDFALRRDALTQQWGESDRDFALRQQAAQQQAAQWQAGFELDRATLQQRAGESDRDFALRQQAAQRGWAADDRDFALRRDALTQQWGESDRDFALRQQAAERGWITDNRAHALALEQARQRQLEADRAFGLTQQARATEATGLFNPWSQYALTPEIRQQLAPYWDNLARFINENPNDPLVPYAQNLRFEKVTRDPELLAQHGAQYRTPDAVRAQQQQRAMDLENARRAIELAYLPETLKLEARNLAQRAAEGTIDHQMAIARLGQIQQESFNNVARLIDEQVKGPGGIRLPLVQALPNGAVVLTPLGESIYDFIFRSAGGGAITQAQALQLLDLHGLPEQNLPTTREVKGPPRPPATPTTPVVPRTQTVPRAPFVPINLP